MNTLLSTTSANYLIGYQKASSTNLHNIPHKKARWFEKHTPRK